MVNFDNKQVGVSMDNLFISIIDKSTKDNTYKFALAKFLLDFSKETSPREGDFIISYTDIASKFLEYYWYQECKYKLKQDFKIKRMPTIIRIIRKYCGESYIPESYNKYFENRKDMKESMIREIELSCLQDVIPRFQSKNNFTFYKHFHTLDPQGKKYRKPPKDRRYIILSKEGYGFFRENHAKLNKILVYAWAKFLEKTNFTPKLISKIEDLGHTKRSSLGRYKKILLELTGSKCFYCNKDVNPKDIHIDHFIPWSYLYDDELWNLVISCPNCNLKKSDRLAPESCLVKIEERNQRFKLNEYNKDIREYYDNCKKAGFISLTTYDLDCVDFSLY